MSQIWFHVARGLGAACMAGLTGAGAMMSLATGDMLLGMMNILVSTFLVLGVMVDIDSVRELSSNKS